MEQKSKRLPEEVVEQLKTLRETVWQNGEFRQWFYGEDGALRQVVDAFQVKMNSMGCGERAKELQQEECFRKGIEMCICALFAVEANQSQVISCKFTITDDELNRTIRNQRWQESMKKTMVKLLIKVYAQQDATA